MNGYNFTERVRKVLALAREEAAALNHEYVGTEHILLGILAEGAGVASTVLSNLGIVEAELRDRVTSVVKHGNPSATHGPDLPYTSRGKKVLELAMSEASQLQHAYVGTEHLLLGLVREERGIAAQVLRDAGVTIDRARVETIRVLGDGSSRKSPVRPRRAISPASGGLATVPESIRQVLIRAFEIATRDGREPNSADLLQALTETGEVAAALTTREIEIDSLIEDVRDRLDKRPS